MTNSYQDNHTRNLPLHAWGTADHYLSQPRNTGNIHGNRELLPIQCITDKFLIVNLKNKYISIISSASTGTIP